MPGCHQNSAKIFRLVGQIIRRMTSWLQILEQSQYYQHLWSLDSILLLTTEGWSAQPCSTVLTLVLCVCLATRTSKNLVLGRFLHRVRREGDQRGPQRRRQHPGWGFETRLEEKELELPLKWPDHFITPWNDAKTIATLQLQNIWQKNLITNYAEGHVGNTRS